MNIMNGKVKFTVPDEKQWEPGSWKNRLTNVRVARDIPKIKRPSMGVRSTCYYVEKYVAQTYPYVRKYFYFQL